ncbi:MAG TPA: hypothetical protein VFH56_09475 [Acidimicrobiales bacterium]|nr:hypothetical protein [Acidimicrobiales bacterium]
MSVLERIIEAVLPSQELMRMERDYIQRTGQRPTTKQEKGWKKQIRRASLET